MQTGVRAASDRATVMLTRLASDAVLDAAYAWLCYCPAVVSGPPSAITSRTS